MKNPRILGTALALGLAAGPACHKDKKTETPNQIDKQNDDQAEGYYGQMATIVAIARDAWNCTETGNVNRPEWNSVAHPNEKGIVGAKSFSSDNGTDTLTTYHYQRGGGDMTLRTIGNDTLDRDIVNNYVDEGADGRLDYVYSDLGGQRREATMRDQAAYELALAQEAKQCREALRSPAVQPTPQSVARPSSNVAVSFETTPNALDVQIKALRNILVDRLSSMNVTGGPNFNVEKTFSSSRWGMVSINYSETVFNGERRQHLDIDPKGLPKDQKIALYHEILSQVQ